MPWRTWKLLVKNEHGSYCFIPTSLKACNRSGLIFGASASPISLTKKLSMSPSTAHGGEYDAKYVTFELLLIVHAAFVADEIWGLCLKPLVQIQVLQEL